MAQVTIEVNGHPYVVGCEDGQEPHLRELAKLFDVQVRQVSSDVGQLGETRLFLMASLLMADELAEARTRLGRLQAETTRLKTERETIENRSAAALEAAATRIEALAAKAP
jgi:cell division protein ZapA